MEKSKKNMNCANTFYYRWMNFDTLLDNFSKQYKTAKGRNIKEMTSANNFRAFVAKAKAQAAVDFKVLCKSVAPQAGIHGLNKAMVFW